MGRFNAKPLVTAAPAASTSAVAATASPRRWGRRHHFVMTRQYREMATLSHHRSYIRIQNIPSWCCL